MGHLENIARVECLGAFHVAASNRLTSSPLHRGSPLWPGWFELTLGGTKGASPLRRQFQQAAAI